MLLVEVSFLLLLCVSAAADQQGIKVKTGDDATLQCHCPSDAAFTQLEWTRPDQKSNRYVFFYRNKRSYKDYQHPSFQGRVELRDPEMKSGDVSVTVKNVTVNDAGTYNCKIISSITKNSERNEFSNFVSLTVTDSEPSDPLAEGNKEKRDKEEGDNGGGNEDEGNTGVVLAVCLPVAGLLLIIGSCFIRYKLMNKQTYVQTEKTEKDAGLHVTQTNHMSQCVDQWKHLAV